MEIALFLLSSAEFLSKLLIGTKLNWELTDGFVGIHQTRLSELEKSRLGAVLQKLAAEFHPVAFPKL